MGKTHGYSNIIRNWIIRSQYPKSINERIWWRFRD